VQPLKQLMHPVCSFQLPLLPYISKNAALNVLFEVFPNENVLPVLVFVLREKLPAHDLLLQTRFLLLRLPVRDRQRGGIGPVGNEIPPELLQVGIAHLLK